MKSASLPLIFLALAGDVLAQQQPLGRLFFTPEQRVVLERQRQRNQNTTLVEDGTPLTLNGRVTRSSGRNTAWINGTPLDEQDARTLGGASLRPGETVFGTGQGERSDLLNGGQITINRRPARP